MSNNNEKTDDDHLLVNPQFLKLTTEKSRHEIRFLLDIILRSFTGNDVDVLWSEVVESYNFMRNANHDLPPLMVMLQKLIDDQLIEERLGGFLINESVAVMPTNQTKN